MYMACTFSQARNRACVHLVLFTREKPKLSYVHGAYRAKAAEETPN